MKKLQLIAAFMMALIVSIPVVLSQELSIQKLQGKDNVKGYAKVQDELTVEVLAKIPGEDIIDKQQVRLYIEDSYTFFDSCASEGNGYYKCLFKEPDFEAYEPITFTIELRDDDENIVGSETKTLVVDTQPPVIKDFNVDPLISNGPLTVSYAVEDYALTIGDTSQCSGIKNVSIKVGAQTVASDTDSPGVCTKDNVIPITVNQSGKLQVCAQVKDHLNFASAPKCKEVTIDKAPPTIESVSILDPQGFVITHVHSGEERPAMVTAVITDDGGVDGTQVFANFKELNPNYPDFLPPDLISGDLYSWQNLAVSEVNPCKMTVKAKDLLGNEANKEFPCTIKADDTAPTVTGLISDAQRGGVPLYGFGTQIVIEFDDKDNTGGPGIGFMGKKAYLDLHELDMGENVQADFCSKVSGSTWRCAWLMNPPTSVGEGNYHITLSAETSDDLDNKIGSTQTYEIIYDNTGPLKPQIIDFKVVAGESGVTYQGGAVKGDYVQYTVRSGDFDTAFANFTDIGGSDATNPTSCTESGNTTKDCIFEGLVDLSGPYRAQLSFNFYDDAKNRASTDTTLEIYGIDNETNAKYWKTPPVVTCSPRLIDREMASIFPPLTACRVDLETPRRDITTLAIAGPTSPDYCTGDVALTVNDIYVVNNGEGSTHPIIFTKLEAKDYYDNELKINCPLQVYSKRAVTVGDVTHFYVSQRPQEVPVNITLQFYNNPMGEMNKDIDDKIKKSFDYGIADWKWLGDLRKFLHYGEIICQIKVLLTSIINALFLVTVVLGIAEDALTSSVFGAGAAQAAKAGKITTCNAEEYGSEAYKGTLNDFLNAICSVVNCAATGQGQIGEGFLGGGVPWCKDVKSLLPTLGLGSGIKEANLGINIKDSLILSLACLCLPGIIYNLEKLRQIHCFKSVCLHDLVKESGYPYSFCDEMEGYMTCTFVMGEIFSLLPFIKFFDALLDIVISIISNPLQLFAMALGFVCTETCYSQGSTMFVVCSLAKTVSVAFEAIGAVKALTDSKNKFGGRVDDIYCGRMEKIKDEMEEEEE